MKKQYEKPNMDVIDISPCMILALSIKDSQGDLSEDFAEGHRGTWGNLWEENNNS